MTTPVDRLEQALTVWEYLACICSTAFELARRGGVDPSQNAGWSKVQWHDFRDYLLQYRGEEFDHQRFTLQGEGEGHTFGSLPFALAQWTACSRRVFQISSDLQALLELTPVDELQWKDVPWPFRCFAVALDRPIRNAYDDPCDLLLVQLDGPGGAKTVSPNSHLEIRFFPQTLTEHPPLRREEVRRLEKHLAKQQNGEASAELKALVAMRANHAIAMHVAWFHGSGTEKLKDKLVATRHRWGSTVEASPELRDAVEQRSNVSRSLALRIVVGLCVHLSSLGKKGSAHVRREGDSQLSAPVLKPISVAADIFRVTGDFTLSAEEQASLGVSTEQRGYHELAPHWRRGHYRRPPGHGTDATAPRTVWVRPTLVRRDRLAPDGQVGGSVAHVQ